MKYFVKSITFNSLLLILGCADAFGADTVTALSLNCIICHNPQQPSAVPGLSDLTQQQILQRLLDFKYQRRPNSIMTRLVKGYDEATLQRIAEQWVMQRDD
jgi:cytochrome subunit of sulfide dehydrogenase